MRFYKRWSNSNRMFYNEYIRIAIRTDLYNEYIRIVIRTDLYNEFFKAV